MTEQQTFTAEEAAENFFAACAAKKAQAASQLDWTDFNRAWGEIFQDLSQKKAENE